MKHVFAQTRSSVRYRWLVLVLAASAACGGMKAPPGQPTGSAELEVVPPPPWQPPTRRDEFTYSAPESPPVVQEQGFPTYPESALADEVACVARLLYHILKDGSVTLVRLEWDEPPPPEHLAAFEAQIREAMLGWRFIPSRKWVRTTLENGSIRAIPQAIPKAERAIVRFRVGRGRGVVE